MARLRSARGGGGGPLRTLERLGVSRGVFGASKGWFYVGTGLWTFRKLKSFGERKPELLMQERLRPGDRLVIANGVATIESAAPAARSGSADHRKTGRRSRRKARRIARKSLLTQADLKRSRRRRRRSATS